MKKTLLLTLLTLMISVSTAFAWTYSTAPDGGLIATLTAQEYNGYEHMQLVFDNSGTDAYGTIMAWDGSVVVYVWFDIYPGAMDMYASMYGVYYNYVTTYYN